MASPALQSLGITNLPGLGERYRAASDAVTGATAKVDESLKAKETALAPLEANIRQANATAPAAPKLETISDKFKHQGLDPQQMTDAVQTMFAFAAIGGAMTRTPMTAALSAFSKGIEGLVKGDQMVFQREKDVFDRNLKTAIAKNQQAIDEYKMAAEKHKGDLNGMMTEWRLIAAKHQDTVALAQFESQNAKGAMQHIENLVKMDEQARRMDQQFSAQMARITAQQDAQGNRGWQLATRPDGSTVRLNVATGEVQPVAGLEGAGKFGKPPPGAGAAGLTGKLKESYLHNENNIEALRDVIKQLDANPDAFGFKTMMPGLLLNRYDPEGTPVRASLSNIKSMTIKERAGTAQTASEMKNLAPFLPVDGDDPATVRTKIDRMITEMERMNRTITGTPGAPAAPRAPGGGSAAGAPALVNAKGWGLQVDAQGRKAYVGPNLEVEEVP